MKRTATILLFVFAPLVAEAWNATGHKAIALIAYGQMTPKAKVEVDRLLARHPDYSKWISGTAAADRGRDALLAASTWSDTIRSDPRFHDDNRRATLDIPGLPSGAQARHEDWHYIALPFSPDATATRPVPEPNILTTLRDFESFGSMPEPQKVYILPWLIHLVGDAHQPLHTLGRFTKATPKGDHGGTP